LVPMGCVIDFFDGGLALWLILLLSHLLFGFKENRTIPRLVIYVSLVEHAIQRFVLKSTSTSSSVCVATSRVVILSSGVKGSALVFLLWRSIIFLPVLWWAPSI
jgi:hypothetical protein